MSVTKSKVSKVGAELSMQEGEEEEVGGSFARKTEKGVLKAPNLGF